MLSSTKSQLICSSVIVAVVLIGLIGYILLETRWHSAQRELVEKKCQEYEKVACDHPSPHASISLGENATLGQYPHLVYVQTTSDDDHSQADCTGSLISDNFVLSAAHCVYGFRSKRAITKVKLGSLTRNLTDGRGKVYKVKEAYIHPQYSENTKRYDFLLLELDQKVTFTPNIRPICINTVHDETKYDRVIVSGWGLTEDGITPDVLKTVELTTKHAAVQKLCNQFSHLLLRVYFICAAYPGVGKSARQGDSGGPLMIRKGSQCPNVYEQIAVTALVQIKPYKKNEPLLSWYSITEHVVPWIASIVWPSESAWRIF